jgi:hypothetical protein
MAFGALSIQTSLLSYLAGVLGLASHTIRVVDNKGDMMNRA